MIKGLTFFRGKIKTAVGTIPTAAAVALAITSVVILTITAGIVNVWADNFFGTSGPDTLVGTDNDDNIFGEQGSDNLSGEGGDDYIDGHAGNDEISDGPGSDIILAGTGLDNIEIEGTGEDEGEQGEDGLMRSMAGEIGILLTDSIVLVF